MNQANNTPPKVKLIRLAPLSLRKNYDDNDGKPDYGTLTFSIRGAYPRITIYTSNANKPIGAPIDYTKYINAPFDYITFGIFLGYFDDVIASKEVCEKRIDCLNVKFENKVKTNEIYLQGTAVVGRDAEGIIYLSVEEADKIKLRFDILPSQRFFTFYDTKGNVLDKREASTRHAKSYIDLLKHVIKEEAKKEFTKTLSLDAPQYKTQYPSKPANNTTVEPQKTTAANAVFDIDDLL